MNNMSEETVARMAKLPDVLVLGITAFFAMGGGLMFSSVGVQSIWGAWIPLCCLTIPPLFYLSREVARLRQKVDALESRSR